MKPSFGLKVSVMRFFWCCKCANIYVNVIGSYLRSPFLSVLGNAKITRGISKWRRDSVLHIFKLIDYAKITYSVICFIAIYMVNLVFRPRSVNIKPCQPVCKEPISKKFNSDVVLFAVAKSSYVTGSTNSETVPPSKNTCVWVIVQIFFENFLSKVRLWVVHAIALLRHMRGKWRQGLEPLSAANTLTYA